MGLIWVERIRIEIVEEILLHYIRHTNPQTHGEDDIMSELDELIKQIEELRSSTINVQEGKSHTDPEVVDACHELHSALDRYQGMLMRITQLRL